MNSKIFKVHVADPCFDQMALFLLLKIGQIGTFNLFNALTRIVKLEKNFPQEINNKITLALGNISLKSINHQGITTILNSAEWVKYLGAFEPRRPSEIDFQTNFEEFISLEQNKAASVNDRIIDDVRFMERQLICHAIGMAYEVNMKNIKDKLPSEPKSWPVELQFFKHARNACFHGNIFDIRLYKGKSSIDPKNPPSWRNYSIPDESINGKIFGGEFFPPHMVLPFLAEMGELINQIVKYPNERKTEPNNS